MKYVQGIVVGLALVLLSPDAAAESPKKLVLDYDTQASGCPDAGQFSDEVSSKLGFVPWSEEGDRLRVRIRREESGEFVGTVELPDGNAKILRDTSCPTLTSALASAVSVALDRASAPPVIQAPVQENYAAASIEEPTGARVHIRGKNTGMVVSVVTARVGELFADKELCTIPCSFTLEPGIQQLNIGTGIQEKFELEAGDTYLVVENGSSGLAIGGGLLAISGSIASLVGLIGVLRSRGDTIWWGVGGGGLAAMWIGAGMLHRAQDELNYDNNPPQMTARAVSYSGTF